MEIYELFCEMIRNRTTENKEAMNCLQYPCIAISPAISILRQELDSMVRVVFLLSIDDRAERRRLIESTLRGEKWKVLTPKGKYRDVTDREMVDQAQHLQGWTQSVYKFGCAFIHLSDFHNHHVQNPFAKLPDAEEQDILTHMRHYHGGPCHDNPDMQELARYVPRVLEKISGNLECYLKHIECNEMLDA